MKFEITNERPNIKKTRVPGAGRKGILTVPIREFIESEKRIIVFTFDKEDETTFCKKYHRISEIISRIRKGCDKKIILRSSKEDRIIYLEKLD